MKTTPLLIFILITISPLLFGEGQNELDLGVPWFGQEEQWEDQGLGDSSSISIGTHGCALTASAMVLKYHGINTDPGKLNRWLLKNEGFEKGWDDETGEYLGRVRLIWNSPVQGFPEIRDFVRYDFASGPADLELIRSFLDKGMPVIAEVLRPRGIPHFVVLTGYGNQKNGEPDFLIRDPLDQKTEYLSEGYDISDEYGSGAARNIFGIRVFVPE